MDGMRCMMGIAQWSGGNRDLDGRQKTLLGPASKPFIWTGIVILHLDGCQNASFGLGIEKLCLDGHQNTSFGRASKFVFWAKV